MRGKALTATGIITALVAAQVASTALAAESDSQDSENAFRFEIGAGREYDSNVAVLELDQSANAGDSKTLIDFAAAYDMPQTGRFDLKAGYNFSETAHDDFDEFDVRIHRASSTISYDLGRVDTGLVLQHARAELDGADFLTLTQVSPYLSKLIGQQIFLRLAYIYTDKDFASNPERAAQAGGLSSDLYFFLNGVRTYLLFGIRYDEEDAVDAALDYSGGKLRSQLSHRLTLGARDLTLKAGLRSEHRNYDNETPSIGAVREDRRLQFEASGELPLTEHWMMQLQYTNSNNRSNLPSMDFREDVLALYFRATF